MRAEGYPLKQISHKLIKPTVGSGKKKTYKKSDKEKLKAKLSKLVTNKVKQQEEKAAKAA